MNEELLIEVIKSHLSRGLVRRFNFEKPLQERSESDLRNLISEWIINPHVEESWNLLESVFSVDQIKGQIKKKYPGAHMEFRVWLTPSFLNKGQASTPEDAGIRSAIIGSLWMIIISFLFSFPIGICTAIYMAEYAPDNRFTRLIQTNIYNLAGIPSIVYGLLGLAVFVRFLGPITSGRIFLGASAQVENGRTILSAGLTLGLLVLPLIIINAQEAFKAIPNSLRLSSYGLGATKWQTLWYHLLPNVMDRVLTGTILAISRAIGETAPLVVIGASTFIAVDPTSVFHKFTTLPIQIYQWSSMPQPEYRNIAAAAIIVLLVVLLSMNTVAIIMRDRFSKKRRVG